MIPVEVGSLALDPETDTPVVTLVEVDGERTLPIWIGPGEASAISMRLNDMTLARPLTHDLAGALVTALGGRMTQAKIHTLSDAMYMAEIVVERDDESVAVDARPSDAIAIALRMDAEIVVAEELLQPARRPPASAGTS